MPLRRLFAALVLFVLAGIMPVHAQSAQYSVTVPVADTTTPVRNQAFAAALTQVLAREAGGQDPRTQAGYNDALAQAAGLVQQYQYKRDSAGAAALSLEVTFDPAAVRRVMGSIGGAAAGPRPPVLMIVRDAKGKLLGADALVPLVQAAQARGFDAVFPDPASVPDPVTVAAADSSALASIARRYNTGLILQGIVSSVSADWTLVASGKAQSWQDSGQTEAALLTNGAGGMADRLEHQLASVGTGSSKGVVWVSGLHSAADYAAVLAAIRNDPAVRSVTTVGAQEDGVLLEVNATTALTRVMTGLGAGGHLLPASSAHEAADVSLRWLP
jgi:uncharacterized protein